MKFRNKKEKNFVSTFEVHKKMMGENKNKMIIYEQRDQSRYFFCVWGVSIYVCV